MYKRRTTDDFISKSIYIHGDRYDYSLVEYKGHHEKVTIICKEHGEFEQIASVHLRGSICKRCSANVFGDKKRNLTLENKLKSISQPEDYKLIPLTKGFFAKVDNEDFERLSKINWRIHSGGYAYSSVGLMHRHIIDVSEDMQLDHINHDKLDNRKFNLRICTNQENNFNSRSQKDSSSIYKGVSYFYRTNTWVAKISINGKTKNLGYYKTEIEAAKAYDTKAKELFGEFAYLNFK